MPPMMCVGNAALEEKHNPVGGAKIHSELSQAAAVGESRTEHQKKRAADLEDRGMLEDGRQDEPGCGRRKRRLQGLCRPWHRPEEASSPYAQSAQELLELLGCRPWVQNSRGFRSILRLVSRLSQSDSMATL